MKKIILSLVTIASIFSVQAIASDTTSLTKATVKLIKSQQDLNSQINGMNKIAESNLELINKNGNSIKSLENEISRLNEGLSVSSSNTQQISILNSKLEEVKNIAQHAEQSAGEAKGLIAEIKGLNAQYKEESGKVVSSAETAYEKSTIIEEKNKFLENSLLKSSEKINAQDLKISQLQVEIDLLKKASTVGSNEGISSKDTEQLRKLEKKLEETIIKYDIALESLKLKGQKEVTVNCQGEKCKINEHTESIIQDFIK